MTEYYKERFPLPTPRRLRRELRLRHMPWWLRATVIAVPVLCVIGVGLVYLQRGRMSRQPRVHLVQDMDVQPRYGPQAGSDVFADGRAMRMPIAGTVARGALEDDAHFFDGYEIVTSADGKQELRFFESLPPRVADQQGIAVRGAQRFGIYCTPCHGAGGEGNGPVHELAVKNGSTTWVQPTPLGSELVRTRPDGHLYNTIRHGIRNMPAHGSQIPPEDIWAIVAHIRSLKPTDVAAPDATAMAPVTGESQGATP